MADQSSVQDILSIVAQSDPPQGTEQDIMDVINKSEGKSGVKNDAMAFVDAMNVADSKVSAGIFQLLAPSSQITHKMTALANKEESDFKTNHPSHYAKWTEEAGEDLGTGSLATALFEPIAAAGSSLAGMSGLTKVLEPMLKSMPKTKAALSFTAKAAPQGAAIGGATFSQNPTEQGKAEQAASGAALNVVLPPVISHSIDKISKAAGNMLHPLMAMKKSAAKSLAKQSDVSLENLKKIQQGTEGKPVLIGRALQLPNVVQLEENVLPNTPTTGYTKKLTNISKDLYDHASALYNQLTSKNSREFQENSVVSALKDYVKGVRSTSKKNFTDADKAAEGLEFGTDNLKDTAKRLRKEFGQTLDVLGLSSVKNQIKEIQSIINAPEGKKFSLQAMNYSKSILGSLKRKAILEQDPKLSSIYGQLEDGIAEDIESVLNKDGNEEAKAAYDKAQSYYANNIAELSEEPFKGLVSGKTSPELIESKFLPKDAGKTRKLKKLVRLSPKVAKPLLSMRLSKAMQQDEMGNWSVNPQALYISLKNLGDERINLLVKNPEDKKAIEKFMLNMGVNGAALNTKLNPKTGYANIANENIAHLLSGIGELASAAFNGSKTGASTKALQLAYYPLKSYALKSPDLLNLIIKEKEGGAAGSKVSEAKKRIAKAIAKISIPQTVGQ